MDVRARMALITNKIITVPLTTHTAAKWNQVCPGGYADACTRVKVRPGPRGALLLDPSCIPIENYFSCIVCLYYIVLLIISTWYFKYCTRCFSSIGIMKRSRESINTIPICCDRYNIHCYPLNLLASQRPIFHPWPLTKKLHRNFTHLKVPKSWNKICGHLVRQVFQY